MFALAEVLISFVKTKWNLADNKGLTWARAQECEPLCVSSITMRIALWCRILLKVKHIRITASPMHMASVSAKRSSLLVSCKNCVIGSEYVKELADCLPSEFDTAS